MKFMSIFVIIFLAFMIGLNNLFWYYQKALREQNQVFEMPENASIKAEESFGT